MASATSTFVFGAFRLEPAQRRLLHEGTAVDLPPKAFDALVLLVENAGGLVSKETFHTTLWPRSVVSDVNLNKTIWQIRRALGDEHGTGAFVETVSKQGYRFVAAVRCTDGANTISAVEPPFAERAAASVDALPPAQRRVPNRFLWRGLALLAMAIIIYTPLRNLVSHRSETAAPIQGAISTAVAAQGSVALAPIGRQGNVSAETAQQLRQMLALELPISEALRVADSQARNTARARHAALGCCRA